MDPKIGWLYAITCDMYEKEGIIKLGYTEKPHLIEEEVKSSLVQRYGTSLIEPRVKALLKVSNPRSAEKALFAKLIQFKQSNEIFKVDFNLVINALDEIKKQYNPDIPYTIDEVVLEKLLSRLRKKAKKISRDISYQQSMFDWMYTHTNVLGNINKQHLSYFVNNMPRPQVIGSHFDWTKRQENIPALRMREQSVIDVFTINNWDRNDKELHGFLKRLIDVV